MSALGEKLFEGIKTPASLNVPGNKITVRHKTTGRVAVVSFHRGGELWLEGKKIGKYKATERKGTKRLESSSKKAATVFQSLLNEFEIPTSEPIPARIPRPPRKRAATAPKAAPAPIEVPDRGMELNVGDIFEDSKSGDTYKITHIYPDRREVDYHHWIAVEGKTHEAYHISENEFVEIVIGKGMKKRTPAPIAPAPEEWRPKETPAELGKYAGQQEARADFDEGKPRKTMGQGYEGDIEDNLAHIAEQAAKRLWRLDILKEHDKKTFEDAFVKAYGHTYGALNMQRGAEAARGVKKLEKILENPVHHVEHWATIEPKSEFQAGSYARKSIRPGVSLVIARPHGQTTTETQAIAFDVDYFTPSEAHRWLDKYNIQAVEFQAAEPYENPLFTRGNLDEALWTALDEAKKSGRNYIVIDREGWFQVFPESGAYKPLPQSAYYMAEPDGHIIFYKEGKAEIKGRYEAEKSGKERIVKKIAENPRRKFKKGDKILWFPEGIREADWGFGGRESERKAREKGMIEARVIYEHEDGRLIDIKTKDGQIWTTGADDENLILDETGLKENPRPTEADIEKVIDRLEAWADSADIYFRQTRGGPKADTYKNQRDNYRNLIALLKGGTGEHPRQNPLDPKERKAMEALIWKHTGRDYRGKDAQGRKSVMYNGPQGSTSGPLSEMSEELLFTLYESAKHTAERKGAKNNPGLSAADERAAIKIYEKFQGHAPENIKVMRMEGRSFLIDLGRADSVTYETQKHDDRKETLYRHEIEDGGARLYWDLSNNALVIVGHGLEITKHGIEG